MKRMLIQDRDCDNMQFLARTIVSPHRQRGRKRFANGKILIDSLAVQF